MKSLQQKILTLLITSVLVTSILIGGAGIISAQRVITEAAIEAQQQKIRLLAAFSVDKSGKTGVEEGNK